MLGPPETQSPPDAGTSGGPKTQSGGHQLGDKNTTKTADDYRRERYRLDSIIKRVLRVDAMKVEPRKHPANVHRQIGCTWVRVAPSVSMVRPVESPAYHYKGLKFCGSVWVCPLCASKIQERRRHEVLSAIVWANGRRLESVMVSYTFPHRIDQPLSLLLRLQQEAIAYMRGRREYMALMKLAGYAGRIRALEVTHGLNGWHPHTHELLFTTGTLHPGYLQRELVRLWLRACRKVGLYVEGRDDEASFCTYSVDVVAGDEGAAGYLAKMDDQNRWGISHELTKASSKQGRKSGAHPFQLVTEAATHGEFIEYVYAMKSARQLVWSRGFKASVGVIEKSDEEVAEEETAHVAEVIPLGFDEWRAVLKADARYRLLEAAQRDGVGGVVEVLRAIRKGEVQP